MARQSKGGDPAANKYQSSFKTYVHKKAPPHAVESAEDGKSDAPAAAETQDDSN